MPGHSHKAGSHGAMLQTTTKNRQEKTTEKGGKCLIHGHTEAIKSCRSMPSDAARRRTQNARSVQPVSSLVILQPELGTSTGMRVTEGLCCGQVCESPPAGVALPVDRQLSKSSQGKRQQKSPTRAKPNPNRQQAEQPQNHPTAQPPTQPKTAAAKERGKTTDNPPNPAAATPT